MKASAHMFLVSAVFVLVLTSCKKEEVNSKEVLRISPEILTSYAGKDWNTISAELENKKDYLFSTLNMGTTLAAVSIPALDAEAPALHYAIVFNVNRQNIVSVIHVTCTDTLDVKTGNKLFIYYYERAFKVMEGVYHKWATFNIAQQPPITIGELLSKVSTLSCEQPTLDFRNPRMEITAGYVATTRGFSLDLFAF